MLVQWTSSCKTVWVCSKRQHARSIRTLFGWQVVAGFRRLLQLPALLPEFSGHYQRIELPVLPPLPLVPDCVVLMMMDGAQRHGELVADFEPHASLLRKAHVVRMGRLAPTDHAGRPGHGLQMLLRPDPLYPVSYTHLRAHETDSYLVC